MAFEVKPSLRKQTDDFKNVYYTIYWSALTKADKYEIIKSVPSVSGLFELYYMDKKKKLNLFFFAKAWFGGLRNSIRSLTDPLIEKNPKRRKVLENHDIYYRFCMTDSNSDMADVLYFYSLTYFPKKVPPSHSNRYVDIFVNEESPDKLVTI